MMYKIYFVVSIQIHKLNLLYRSCVVIAPLRQRPAIGRRFAKAGAQTVCI